MPFVMNEKPIRSARDTETGAEMTVRSGPEISLLKAHFKSTEGNLILYLRLSPKYPDKPLVKNDVTNPGIMIYSAAIELELKRQRMADYAANTRLVDHAIRLLAFINRHQPLATSPFFWSDYASLYGDEQPSFGMPSDDELLDLSMSPNAG
ncbi:MAG TPA: hypothetical protein VG651_08280 [Stellaceae bacterium]|nr:hypothetical protein [Stellaceae bacterium]